MPKRPNPFGDSSPLQFKSHISVKEIDMGVAQESKMQTVYGEKSKFRPYLFQGHNQTLSGLDR